MQWYDADQDTPGKMITRFGGFIDDVEQFDAEFFGISPREAASMDPQQRLLLELAWDALEDAGVTRRRDWPARKTGVYLGIANNDYGRALFAKPELIDPYFGSGNAFSVAAGRLSYLLGLQGPAWQSTPLARRRWSRCIWLARACAAASAIWRLQAAST